MITPAFQTKKFSEIKHLLPQDAWAVQRNKLRGEFEDDQVYVRAQGQIHLRGRHRMAFSKRPNRGWGIQNIVGTRVEKPARGVLRDGILSTGVSGKGFRGESGKDPLFAPGKGDERYAFYHFDLKDKVVLRSQDKYGYDSITYDVSVTEVDKFKEALEYFEMLERKLS